MAPPAARQNDKVVGMDPHIVMIPTPPTGALVPSPPIPHLFSGTLLDGLSADVKVMGMPAATLGSKAKNMPPHIPQGGPMFQVKPLDEATIIKGSATVFINGKPAARSGDIAMDCGEPPTPGTVIGTGATVQIGG